MSTAIHPTHPVHEAHHAHGSYLTARRGIGSWLFTLDHKRIGIMYLISALTAFLIGGVLALVVRMELFTPGETLMGPDAYNKVFTLHGAIMIFLFVIPVIPAALGNFFLPLQLGAMDVAFPRLNLASFWIYVIGALFAVASMVMGSVDTGWTFYTPYSVQSATAVISIVTAVFILGFSSIFTGVNFVVTIHKMRPAGMGWFDMPLFLWALYATSLLQILATPVLGITLFLLAAERLFGIGIFDPLMGGDPVLFQHFFWFYSHPAVYIMILPAMGIISEVIACFSRKNIFGYRFVALSSIGIAVISFLVWGHHMFISGQSELASVVFSALTFLVAIPSAIKVFNWIATMYRGSILLKTPMIYALMFLFLFSIGGLTGVYLGALGINVHVHDTYFVVAHFHYVILGGTVIAFVAGLHYWWPKMTGRMYPERLAQMASLAVFVGFNATFFPQFILGTQGMPRRYYDYQEHFAPLHQFSTVGAMIMGFGFAGMILYLIWSVFRGPKAPVNPWGATTLEWQTASPPIEHNFHEPPTLSEGGPYQYSVDPREATVAR